MACQGKRSEGGTARAAAADTAAAKIKATTEDGDGVAAVSPPPCVASAKLKAILSILDAVASSKASVQ